MDTMPLVESFLLSRQAKSCRPKTIDWYRMILGRFARQFPQMPASPEG